MNFPGGQHEFRPLPPDLIAKALAAAEDAVVITEAASPGPDPMPRIVFVNDGFTRMTGFAAHEVIGRSPRICQGPKTDRATLDRIRAGLARWEPVCERLLNYRKDGTPFWVELRIRPVADASGWFTHWISIQRDVTDQQEAQDHAAQHLQKLGDACRRARLGTWSWRIGSDTFGLTGVPDGGLEMPLADTSAGFSDLMAAIAPEHRELVTGTLVEASRDGRPATFEIKLRSRDGRLRLIWVLARAQRSDEGAVEVIAGLWQDITEQRGKADLQAWHATHDPHTRLLNRDALMDMGADIGAAAAASGRMAVAILLAVDRLGPINEVYGPWTGDLVVQQMAARLQRQSPALTAVGQFASGQFLVFGDYRDRADLDASVATLLARLRTTFTVAGEAIDLSASAGVACFADAGGDVTAAVEDAHVALVEANQAGTGTAVHYRHRMRETARRRATHLARARQGLESDRIVPFYQPKIRLADGALLGFEALLRVAEGDHFLPPAELGLAFEDVHLARALGRAMTEKVLLQLACWNRAGLAFGAVAINVTSHELELPDFALRLIAHVRQLRLTAGQVQIEITEDAVLGGPATRMAEQLRALKQAGIRVALDDFGTGYASLTHLRSLPVNTLKIDRSFVTSVCTSPEDASIIAGIAGIGRALGMKIIAEGVETVAQALRVRALGCHVMQGYLAAQPMPGAAAAEFVASWPAGRARLGLGFDQVMA